jgi:hypothetical protein
MMSSRSTLYRRVRQELSGLLYEQNQIDASSSDEVDACSSSSSGDISDGQILSADNEVHSSDVIDCNNEPTSPSNEDIQGEITVE